MKSSAWSSFQSALPPEARAGGERDDDEPPAVTIPEKPVSGKRFIEKSQYSCGVYDWSVSGCGCFGSVRGQFGEPCPDPNCPTCKGTGDGPVVPDLVAEGLTEADARLLAFGGEAMRSAYELTITIMGEVDHRRNGNVVKAAEDLFHQLTDAIREKS
jgi:hypothetical protein